MSSAIPFHNELWTPRHKPVISNIERAVVCCKEWPVKVYKSQNDHELTGEGYSQATLARYFVTAKLPAVRNESNWNSLLLLRKLLTQAGWTRVQNSCRLRRRRRYREKLPAAWR